MFISLPVKPNRQAEARRYHVENTLRTHLVEGCAMAPELTLSVL